MITEINKAQGLSGIRLFIEIEKGNKVVFEQHEISCWMEAPEKMITVSNPYGVEVVFPELCLEYCRDISAVLTRGGHFGALAE